MSIDGQSVIIEVSAKDLEESKVARERYAIPQYGTVIMAGTEYYRTRIEDADGKRVALYGRTREELYDKVIAAREQIEDNTFRRSLVPVSKKSA